jgi:hypothetical protein
MTSDEVVAGSGRAGDGVNMTYVCKEMRLKVESLTSQMKKNLRRQFQEVLSLAVFIITMLQRPRCSSAYASL